MSGTVLDFPHAGAWRTWLAAHHSRQDSVWVVITKKGVEPAALQLGDAVEEALCFGWTDSTLHRIDDRSYAWRFSPRRPNGIWSESNKRRVAVLARGVVWRHQGLPRSRAQRQTASGRLRRGASE